MIWTWVLTAEIAQSEGDSGAWWAWFDHGL